LAQAQAYLAGRRGRVEVAVYVGWVSGDGRNYLMAVLSAGSPTQQYGIDTLNHLSARWCGPRWRRTVSPSACRLGPNG
jgi:hypothetical protein